MRTYSRTNIFTTNVVSSFLRMLTTILMLSLTICISSGYAQEPEYAFYEVMLGKFFGIGPRAMGMGGSYIAVADDYSAIYWNPAGLAQVRRIEISGTLSHNKYRNKTLHFASEKTDEVSKTRLNSIGVVYPIPTERGSLVFALGYNRLKNFDSVARLPGYYKTDEWQLDWYINERREMDCGWLGSWSLAGAIDISPSMSVGGSVNLWKGKDDFTWNELGINSDPLPFDPIGFESIGYLNQEYSGVNIKLGGLLKAHKDIKLGMTITSPTTYNVRENSSIETYYEYEDGFSDYDYEPAYYDYEITKPYTLGGGITVKLSDLLLAADAEYIDWTQTEYKSPIDLITENKDFRDHYRDVCKLHFGGEYTIPKSGLSLRAGYFRDPLPHKIKYIKRDRDYITLGMGFLIDSFKIDVALVHGIWKHSDLDLFEEEIRTDRIFCSMAYRF